MAEQVFQFQAPNGVIYQIPNAPDEVSARRRAREAFRDEFPDEFAEWSRNRPLPGFGSAFVQSARGAAGSQVSGAGLLAEEAGIPGGQTLREAGAAIQGQPLPGDRLLEAGTVLEDLQRRPFQTLTTGAGQALGGVLGSIAAPAAVAAGAGALAPAGVATAATIGAGLLAGALSGTSELYDGLVREGVAPERARELAANIGAAIGAAEGGAAVPLIRQILGTTLRKEAVDRIATIAGRSATQQAARGGVRGAAIEGASESAGGAARQAAIAAETGQTDLGRRAGEVLFEGVLGAVGGGGVGAVSGARDPGRARAELEARSSPEDRAIRAAALEASIRDEAPAAAPEPEGPAPLVGERPQPFAAPEQAADYLAANPPPTGLRTPEAAAAWANARRDAEWESQVEAARPTALAEFTAAPATPEATPQSNQSFFGNIAEAAVTDQIRLTGFKPQDVARYAFESRGIQKVKPSEAEIQAVTQRLDSLVADNLLERTPAGTYRVSTQAPGTQTPAQSQAPAPTPASVPGTGPGPAPMPTPAATQAQPPQPTPAPGPGPAPMPTPAPAPTPPMPSAAEQTATPETQRAQGSLAEIAQTGNPASPPAPTEQISAALWTGYSLASGPEASNPIVIAAREVAKASRRLTLNEFQSFANTWTSLPTDADRLAFAEQASQNLGILSSRPAPVAAPLPASAPAPMPAPPLPQPPGTPAAPLPNAPTAGPPPQPAPAPAPAPMQAPTATPNAAPEVTQTGTAQAAPEAGAAQAPAPEQAQEPAPPQEQAAAPEPQGTRPTPADVRQQKQILDQQFATGFRGGMTGKLFASPIATWIKSPIYQKSATAMDDFVVRNYRNVSDVEQAFEPALKLATEAQARIALTLQESRSKQKMWDRAAFTREENAAMDSLLRAGQRAYDYTIDAYTFRFFNPAEAKTPQERARLEAFQAAKGGRLITDLPIAEVAAVSSEGARAIRSYNQMRDKFFFPQISRGSHFVAAYEKSLSGKEKLVRIYFYDPLRYARKARSKVGLQRDPEAESIELLRREFPDAARYRIMARGMESENDQRASALKRDGDFIARYLEDLRNASGPEAQRIIASMSKEIDKAQMDRIFRPNNDLLRAVTPNNAADYIRDVLPYYFLTTSKLQSRRYIQDDFNRSLQGYTNEEKAYWNGVLDYSTVPTEAFATFRAAAYFKYLAFNISSGLIQLAQLPSVVWPSFVGDGAGSRALPIMGKTAAQVAFTFDTFKAFGKELSYTKRLIASGKLPADEVAALQRALKDGRLNPVQATSLRSTLTADDIRRYGIADQSATPLAYSINRAMDLGGRFLAATDEVNRVITFLSAYRVAKAQPSVLGLAGRRDFRAYDAYDYAQMRTGDTNFRANKEDRALIQRFHPVAEIVTQFQGPVFKLLELYARSAKSTVRGLKEQDLTLARTAALQFAALAATQVTLAGVFALPLLSRAKELIEGVLKLVFGEIVDLEQELEKRLDNPFLASTLNYGLFHAMGGVSLTSRLAVDPFPKGDVSSWDVLGVLGPAGGIVKDFINTYQALQLGDYWKASATLVPVAAGNLIRGAQLEIEGEQFTGRGGRIITPEDVERVRERGLLPVGVRQGVGFAPPEFTDIRRQAQRNYELQTATRTATERVNIELSRIVLDLFEAERAGQATRAALLRDRYNTRVSEIQREQESKAPEYRIRIDRNAIIDRARKDLQGRASREVLVQGTRVPAREAAREMYERGNWRNQP